MTRTSEGRGDGTHQNGGVMNTKALVRLASLFSFGAILVLVAVLGSGTAVAAGSFNPSASTQIADGTPSANSDINGTFGIKAPDYNFGGVISFTPAEWGVAKGTDAPIGAVAGELKSKATLGLLGNPCNLTLSVDFTVAKNSALLNASINPADTIDGTAYGTPDRLKPLGVDGNNNGIPDGAEKWPVYLNTLFKDFDLSKIRARLFAANTTDVSGTTVILNS